MEERRVFSGAPWEAEVGYCRAVRAGKLLFVSGCAPLEPDGRTHAPGDPYAQARRCLEIGLRALRDLGADVPQVTRTRMFVTQIDHWREFGRAHGEVFRAHPPATTMVEVRRLIAADMLIEIELDAVLAD